MSAAPNGPPKGTQVVAGPTPQRPATTKFFRRQTAVNTAGVIGASFAVIEKNWICLVCGNENFARRERCFRCRGKKPAGGGGLLHDPKTMTTRWREAIDIKSGHLYYYHLDTNETSWDRPAEMGPAPHATGWFGRGKAGSTDSKFYLSQNEKFLKRPARKQIDRIDHNQYQLPEGANEYNIWYGRYMGEHWKRDTGAVQAEFRCVVATDAGRTKADKSKDKKTPFCIYFARGMCARGHECPFYHRIPIPKDDADLEQLYDVFGRERHKSHRDDMGGVGSFESNSRTLYVGGIRKKDGVNMEKVCWKHFSEWGEVEHINFIQRLSIAFVRYRLRASAEFAKLAMQNQKLDNNECLNIRWAYEDPNPVAKEAIERSDHDAIISALQARGLSTEPAAFDYPANYVLPPATKKSRLEAPELSYPNTDSQYPQTKQQATAEADAQKVQKNVQALDAVLGRIDGTSSATQDAQNKGPTKRKIS